jgi:hypothetical protein
MSWDGTDLDLRRLNNGMRNKLIATILVAGAAALQAQPAPAKPLKPLSILVGEWIENPGKGGMVRFAFEAGGSVLVGRARATRTGPWSELIVVYADGLEGEVRADSFEGTRPPIHYKLVIAEAGVIQFQAKDYRLTYRKTGVGRLQYLLEAAKPDQPGGYSVEASGTLTVGTLVRPLSK